MGYNENERINLIVMNDNIEEAVEELIDMKICISKAEAKRVWHQVRSSNNKDKVKRS